MKDQYDFEFEMTPEGTQYLVEMKAERKRLLGMSRPLTEDEENFIDDTNFLDKQGK